MQKPIARTEMDVLPKSKRKLAHIVELRTIDTTYFKDMEDERLNDPEPAQLMHLHAQTGADYLRQLTAERKVRYARGRVSWEKRRSRGNHQWDCFVYHGALCIVLWKHCLELLPAPQRVAGL